VVTHLLHFDFFPPTDEEKKRTKALFQKKKKKREIAKRIKTHTNHNSAFSFRGEGNNHLRYRDRSTGALLLSVVVEADLAGTFAHCQAAISLATATANPESCQQFGCCRSLVPRPPKEYGEAQAP
jgi:hypothetical protein